MQHSPGIITSSNSVNKKLSFKGWNNCIEAFSLSKGTSAHYRARLQNSQKSLHQEEIISDEDSDDTSQPSRLRPNRTLASQIDFSECLPTLEKGRRLISARFKRSVEKRSLSEEKKGKIKDPFATQFLNSNHEELSTTNDYCCSFTNEVNCNTQVGYNISTQASLLNARLALDDSSLNNESLSELTNHEFSTGTPDNFSEENSTNKDEIKSPIFKIQCVSKRKSVKKSHQLSLSSNNDPVRHLCKDDFHSYGEQSSFQVDCTVVDGQRYDWMSPPRVIREVSNQPEASGNVSQELQEIRSPVFQKSMRRRKHSFCVKTNNESNSPILGSVNLDYALDSVEKSPILGSSNKSLPNRKRKKTFLVKGKKSENISTNDTSADINLSGDRCDLNCMAKGILIHKLNLLDPEDVRKAIPYTNCGIAAKRSLDFSIAPNSSDDFSDESKYNQRLESERIKSQSLTCEEFSVLNAEDSDSEVIESSQIEPVDSGRGRSKVALNVGSVSDSGPGSAVKSTSSRLENSLLPGTQTNLNSYQEFWPDQSCIIEEANTEEMPAEFNPFISSKTSSKVHRKKCLSLRKRGHRNDVATKVQQNVKLGCSYSFGQHAGKISSLIDGVIMESDVQVQSVPSSVVEKKLLKKCSSPGARILNETCRIEEVFSEPCDDSFQIEHLSNKAVPVTMGTKISLLKPRLRDLPTSGQNQAITQCMSEDRLSEVSETDAADIDSCSSISAEGHSPNLAEELSSTPVIISQSSTPRSTAHPKASVPVSDDFNSPLKKGRKKLKPGGLAYRLQRLLNQQGSSSRIWQFQRGRQGLNKAARLASGGSGSQGDNDGTLIGVYRTRIEYSHIVIEGFLSEGDKSVISNSVVVILDTSVAERTGRVMSAHMIRIFPPWQALTVRGTTVILCVNCIEIVPSPSSIVEPKKQLVLLREFKCPCINGFLQQSCPEHSGFLFTEGKNNTPVKLLDLLFPQNQEDGTCLLTCGKNILKGSAKDSATLSSVSQLVTSHCSGETSSGHLTATVLRVFQYWQLSQVENDTSLPIWSFLGQDALGEMCEITLGSKDCSTGNKIYQDAESGKAVGKTYQFSEFIPVKRVSPFRSSSLWTVVSSIDNAACDQPVLYVLSPAAHPWHCKLVKEGSSDQPYFSALSKVVVEEENSAPWRLNFLCRLLHATTEVLYITDTSTSPRTTVINLQPSVYLPAAVAHTRLLSLLDIETSAGEMRADRYSRIMSESSDLGAGGLHNAEQLRCLASLNPRMPKLKVSTAPRTIASVVGTIVGVDEGSAFMWPACGHCGNELLCVEARHHSYKCNKCSGLQEKVVLRMSLQVILSCKNLPQESSVRLKLLQSTIERLLPPSLDNEDGYDMNSVLGQELGPLSCEVLFAQGGNFIIQELPPFI